MKLQTYLQKMKIYYEGSQFFTPTPGWGHLWSKKDPVFLLSFADQHFQVSAPST